MKTTYAIILLSFFLIIFSPTLSSQDGDVYVSLGGGASIPLAEYAATDFSQAESGFAKVGGNFNIYFGYRFNEYISIAGLMNGCMNRYNYLEAQAWLTEEYPESGWIVESKNWGLGGLLIGPDFSLPLITNRLFFEARVLGGFLYAYSPAIYVTGKESGEPDKILNIEQGSSASWAFDVGAGFRYNRTRKQYFILFADYMYSQPEFSNIGVNTEEFGFQRADNFTQKISTVNISIGIGYIVN